MYCRRGLETILDEAVAEFPAVMLHGTRQVGKTTMLRRCLGDHFGYVSVERPQIRQLAADETGWLVYSGDLPLPLGNGNIALPFFSL